MQKSKISFDYDETADVLYASFGKPMPAKTIEKEGGLLLRMDSLSNRLVGFSIIGYMQRVNDGTIIKSEEIKDIE